jgi:hypothetical protein
MKNNIFSALFSAGFLLLLLTACSLPAAKEAASKSQAVLASPTTEVFPTTAPTLVIPSPVPYIPPPPTLTPVLLPQTVPVIPIQFDPGGTSEDIQGSVPAGGSKTYMLGAVQSQIMSVSILGGYFPLQIQGRDGQVLCPAEENAECYFWRGELPATQEYYIIVKSSNDQTKYTMRVAINPPGIDAQYFQYQNPSTGLSLTYPDTFAPAIPVPANYKTEPELALQFIDSTYYDNTNLSEVYFLVSSTSDSQVVKTCTEPNQNGGGPEQIVGNEGINGYTFVHNRAEGAGAGNFYQQEIYRMVNNNVCYEVIYYIHSTNIGNYPPGTVTEFDRDTILQQLYGVFSTFTIK